MPERIPGESHVSNDDTCYPPWKFSPDDRKSHRHYRRRKGAEALHFLAPVAPSAADDGD
jgi:hypothetical protein